MNKSLIALAVMAASGAAMAQSSVTVYGRLDLSVGNIKQLGEGSETKMFNGGNGGLTTPRLGFKGSEDLGGGLKANFKLEQRINAEDGSLQDPSFKAESSVGLSGGFGKFNAGRMTTVYDDIRAVSYSSNVFDSAFTPASNGVFKSGGDYSSRFNSQIRYELPELGGFYGGVSYAFEQTADAGDKMTALMLGYKNGPLNVGLGMQDEKGKDTDYLALSAAYDLGPVSLSAGINKRNGTDATGDDNEYTFGVNVPLGAVNLSAGFATSKTQVGGATTAKASGFGLGATYSMSKRSRLYAGYRSHNVKDGAGTKTADTQLFALGIRHDF